MASLIPDVTLPAPKVMLLLSESILVHNFENVGQAANSGVIKKIYSTSEFYAEGDTVLFDESKAEKIGYSGNVFYLIDEKNIFFKENPQS